MEEKINAMAENPTADGIKALYEELTSTDLSNGATAESLTNLIEAWDDTVEDDEAKAEFCIKIAELSAPDNPMMRSALTQGIRHFLPKMYKRRGFLTVLGFRDTSVALPEIVKRYKKMQILEEGTFLYQPESHNWGTVGEIDRFSMSLTFNPISGKSSLNVPLQEALNGLLFFDKSYDLKKVATPDKKKLPAPEECVEILTKAAAIELTDSEIRDIVFYSFVPSVRSANNFDEWWLAQKAKTDNTATRKVADCRSLHELHIALDQLYESGEFGLDDDDLAKAIELVDKLKVDLTDKDKAKVLEIFSLISEESDNEHIKDLLERINDKYSLWPQAIRVFDLDILNAWNEVDSRYTSMLVKATVKHTGEEYAATLACYLPQRLIAEFNNLVSETIIDVLCSNSVVFTPNVLCHIWKNRSSVDERLKDLLTFAHVTKSLTLDSLPSGWQTGFREMKRLLIEGLEFQKLMLSNAGDNLDSVVFSLHTATYLTISEQQSLLVKLSRNSPELRSLLESGKAEKLLASNRQDDEDPDKNQPTITSIFSYNDRLRYLQDIINRQMPENTAAIAHARSYGDLRENAEYKAAKEEESRLLKRRGELESDILSAQPTDFRQIEVEDVTVVGCTINIETGGKELTYHLVGAWDGDPERDLISYKTKLGQLLMHKSVGDSIDMPNVGNGTIKAINSLSNDLLEEFAKEE